MQSRIFNSNYTKDFCLTFDFQLSDKRKSSLQSPLDHSFEWSTKINSLTAIREVEHANYSNETPRIWRVSLQRERAYSWHRQRKGLQEYTAGRHTSSGKGPANFAGHGTSDPTPTYGRVSVRCTPGIRALWLPSPSCFGKCLPPHRCQPIYVLLSDPQLAYDATSDVV